MVLRHLQIQCWPSSGAVFIRVWHSKVLLEIPSWSHGSCFNIKTVFPGVRIPDRLLWACDTFIMGIPILVKQYLHIATNLRIWALWKTQHLMSGVYSANFLHSIMFPELLKHELPIECHVHICIAVVAPVKYKCSSEKSKSYLVESIKIGAWVTPKFCWTSLNLMTSQRTCDAIITSLLHQDDMMSFWRNNDIITSCVRWAGM